MKQFVMIVAGVFGVAVTVELGRANFYMKRVEHFAATIEQTSPAEVKWEVAQFADGLNDHNPLVARSAMTAMKLATGWRLSSDPQEWLRMWNEQKKDWEYQKPLPASARTNAPVKPRWVDMLPPQVTQTSAPPATVTISPPK